MATTALAPRSESSYDLRGTSGNIQENILQILCLETSNIVSFRLPPSSITPSFLRVCSHLHDSPPPSSSHPISIINNICNTSKKRNNPLISLSRLAYPQTTYHSNTSESTAPSSKPLTGLASSTSLSRLERLFPPLRFRAGTHPKLTALVLNLNFLKTTQRDGLHSGDEGELDGTKGLFKRDGDREKADRVSGESLTWSQQELEQQEHLEQHLAQIELEEPSPSTAAAATTTLPSSSIFAATTTNSASFSSTPPTPA